MSIRFTTNHKPGVLDVHISVVRMRDLGFNPDIVVTAAPSPGLLTLSICKNVNYKELVKHAREHKLQILQVCNNKRHLYIGVPAYLFAKAGIIPGKLTVSADIGIITVTGPLS